MRGCSSVGRGSPQVEVWRSVAVKETAKAHAEVWGSDEEKENVRAPVEV